MTLRRRWAVCVGVLLLAPGWRTVAQPPPAEQVQALCRRALAHKRAGQPAAAAVAYREALRLDPESVDAHWGLAWILAGQGARDDAVREFQRVLELSQDQGTLSEAQAALARLGAAADSPPPDTLPPPPPPVPTPSLAAARDLLAQGHHFAAIRVLRQLPADESVGPEAEALLQQAKRGRRTVRVTAAPSVVFRSQEDWEARLRTRFAAAAAQIGRQVPIDFVLAAIEPWDEPASGSPNLDLMSHLQEAVAPGDTDVVIGVLAERRQLQPSAEAVRLEGYTLGLAPCFSGDGIVAEVIGSDGDRTWRIPEIRLQENLAHELCHIFGAIHIRGNTLMRPEPGPVAVFELDPINAALTRTARWLDFDDPLGSLSRDELSQMADLYAQAAAGPAADDGVHFYRATVLTSPALGRYEEAAEEYAKVLAASPEDAFAHYNLAELYFHLGRVEEARAHWKLAAFIGKPAWVAARAQEALSRPTPATPN